LKRFDLAGTRSVVECVDGATDGCERVAVEDILRKPRNLTRHPNMASRGIPEARGPGKTHNGVVTRASYRCYEQRLRRHSLVWDANGYYSETVTLG
jgi:hypothetical protein